VNDFNGIRNYFKIKKATGKTFTLQIMEKEKLNYYTSNPEKKVWVTIKLTWFVE